jgi:putative endonuclease
VPHVYILRCRDGSLYTGATTDLPRRLGQHRAGTASRYTRSRLPVELVWARRVASWSAALREERRIKALPRPAKLQLARGTAVAAPRQSSRTSPPSRSSTTNPKRRKNSGRK